MRSLLILLLAALLASCSQPKNRFRLEGSFKSSGSGQAQIYAYSEDQLAAGVDTIRIEGGDFVYERTLDHPVVLTLLYPNFSQTYIVAEPGQTVTMKGDASKLSEAKITGTDENELLTDFRLQQSELETADQTTKARLAAAHFIRSNPSTLAAVAVFRRYFASQKDPDAALTRSLLAELAKAQPQSESVATLRQRLDRIAACSPGQPLPDFSLTTIDGAPVRRADFSGRPLVVVFSASWTGTSSVGNTLRRLRRAYGNRLALLFVSFDMSVDECRARTTRDSVACPIVCDGLAFSSPAARTLGVRYVPGNLLMNASGTIVARDLQPEELERRVALLLQ